MTLADLRLIESYFTETFAPWLTQKIAQAESGMSPELEEEVLGTLFYGGEVLARPGRIVEVKRRAARDQRELARLREAP
ncbi:MAG: hypothetical protein IH945_02120 [Armatimonadetes bacterium]|nr:hypothetical protein [Armatimonadota bacterium]